MNDTVAAALEAALPQVAAPLRARLQRFVDVLAEENRTLNLTAARTPQAYAEHVRDSLTLAPYVAGSLVDVGSGGGFPAIPLALATGAQVTLVESVAKKARFLQRAVVALDLPATVVTGRAEEAARRPELREAFACATARAIGPATTVLELTLPFLRLGGLALLQRGDLGTRERAAVVDAALVLGADILEERAGADGQPCSEFDAGRRLLVVRKTRATPDRFPRRAGVPAKRPLCYEESR